MDDRKMQYGDFLSIVQLGVGLHAGTALLQLYGEIGLQPLMRSMKRIKSLLDLPENTQNHDDCHEEFADLRGKISVFEIQLNNEYKTYILINFTVAVILILLMIILTYQSQAAVSEKAIGLTVFIIAISLLPAPISVGVLWYDASQRANKFKDQAEKIEGKLLKHE
jgi:hypothetical protein